MSNWNVFKNGLGLTLLAYLGTQYWARKRFQKESQNAESAFLKGHASQPRRQVQDLPEALQAFLKFSQLNENNQAEAIRLELKGKMRLGPHRKWRSFKASQAQMLNPPALVWHSETHIAPALKRLHREAFMLGQQRDTEGLVACIPRKNKQAELWSPWSYYLVGMAWMPAAFLAPDWEFEVLDTHRVMIQLSPELHPQADRVKGILEIGSDGRLLSLQSTHHRQGDGVKNWVFLFEGWDDFNGLKLPVRGRAIRRLNDETSFDYLHMQINALTHLNEHANTLQLPTEVSANPDPA